MVIVKYAYLIVDAEHYIHAGGPCGSMCRDRGSDPPVVVICHQFAGKGHACRVIECCLAQALYAQTASNVGQVDACVQQTEELVLLNFSE